MIERIVDELKVLPAVPADATARVLARVDAARRGEGESGDACDDDDVIFFPTSTDEMRAAAAGGGPPPCRPAPRTAGRAGRTDRRRFVVSLPAAIGYALAATVAGFLIRGAMPRERCETTTASRRRRAALGERVGAATTLVLRSRG